MIDTGVLFVKRPSIVIQGVILHMKKRDIWHIALIIYVVFIFSNSLTPADISSENSDSVLQLAHRIFNLVGIQALWLTDHVVRKCAHFAEYTLLGMLLLQSRRCMPRVKGTAGRFHLAAFFFIPFVDETLQLFTEGRSGQISDVWLDMSGVLCGTLLCMLVMKLRIKKIKIDGK